MSTATISAPLETQAKKIACQARKILQEYEGRLGIQPSDGGTSSLQLAHYTSLEALISMLQDSDGGLRLSDSSTMNDPGEGHATRDGREISRLLDGTSRE